MKIGVIGLGLIGGSILLALGRDKSCEVYVVSESSYKKALKITPFAGNDLNILKSCEVVFVCTPMEKTNATLKKLNGIVSKNTVVADVSSVKCFLEKENLEYNFISSHPMAGKETSGFEAADCNLFQNCVWILEKNNKQLEEIIKNLGAKPCIISAEEHDRATAIISHLPLVMSIALFDVARKNKTALALASSGFRDTTRLAAGNPQMTKDILKFNSGNVNAAIDELIQELNYLKNCPENEKIELFKNIQAQRCEMYDKNGKNRGNI